MTNTAPGASPVAPLETAFRLDDLTIDPRAGEVSGPGGRETLDPKVMGVLVRLAQHAGQVVTRHDLLATIWPGVVVSEYAVSRCIYELRRQLSQAGGDERYKSIVETLPKRGYRLLGRVEAQSPPEAVDPARQPTSIRRAAAIGAALVVLAGIAWLVAARWAGGSRDGATAAPAAPRPASVAVLPFVDMSETQDQRHLSDGIAEEILNQLARIEGLRVIARTSSFMFRDQAATDVREIGAKLGVTHVLEGSVRASDDRLRITAQLIDASSNLHLWSMTYDRAPGDLFAIQDEIAASVATALDLELGDKGAAAASPVDPAAYELLLQGEFLYNRRSPGDVARALNYYERSLEIDPDYARAWAALAGAYSLLGDSGEVSRSVARAKQQAAAERALALDPRSPDAHNRLAQFHFETGDLEQACKHFRAASLLDEEAATHPEAECWILWPYGDAERQIELERRRVARDPLSAAGRANFAVMLMADGRLEEAKAELLKARDLRAGDFPDVDVELVRILVLQRRYDEALPAIAALPEGDARDHGTALLFDAPGHRVEADAALARLVGLPDRSLMESVRLAEVFAWRGMREQAFWALESARNAIDPGDESVFVQIWSLQQEMSVSPFLVPLQDDPRWRALMAKPAGA